MTMPDRFIHSATSACFGDRHWNCSGHLRHFPKFWKIKAVCACPCHTMGLEGVRDAKAANNSGTAE